MTRLVFTLIASVVLPSLGLSKRIGPAMVTPVIHGGVRYVAPNDNGRRAYIEAWDAQTNRKLWELNIFANHIDPKLEEDVQWVFIKTLTIQDGRLMVTSERGERYSIDLKTRAVTRSDLASSSTPNPGPQVHKIPNPVERAIRTGSLPKDYDVSFHMDPFYLTGDFNGDGKVDVAVLVKQRATGKLGIAIVHSSTNKVTILGAGSPIGNGGDDFAWMDIWQVYSKARGAHGAGETGVPRLRGDALLLSKSEAASALIYWNGKRYVWFQQGD
jgi:hypothetical protein